MPRFDELIERLLNSARRREIRLWFKRQPLPEIKFQDIRRVEKPPRNEEIEENIFYFVFFNNRPKWVLFLCPCGCKEVVTLSLQKSHYPHWILKKSRNKRPTLSPSVWRDIGCMSHFWMEDGRIYWCQNTGFLPNNFYSST
jgi:hypothetical protein